MEKKENLTEGIIIDNVIYSYQQIIENHKKSTMIGKCMYIKIIIYNNIFVITKFQKY